MFFRFLTYNKFKSKKWDKMSPEKRLKAFQKLENIQAKKHGRKACRVLAVNMEENMNGVHLSGENVIKINTNFVYYSPLRFYGMATLFHEGRHAFQHHAINQEKVSIFSKAYRWKKNFQGYTSTEDDKYSFYSMQPVERDANLYAIRRMKRFRFRYRKEPIFAQTLKDKIEQFDEVKELAKKELGAFYSVRVALKNRKNRKENE